MDDKSACPEFVQLFRAVAGAEEKVSVPLLTHGSAGLIESWVICEYIEEAFPGPQLMPATASQRASVRYMSELFRTRLGPGASGGVHALLATRSCGELERAQRLHLAALQALQAGLEIHSLGDGPFVNGAEWSLAETLAAPWLARMHMLLPVCRGLNTIELAQQAGLTRAAEWIQAVIERPSVRSSTPAVEDVQRVWANCIPQWDEAKQEVDRSQNNFETSKVQLAALLGKPRP